PAVAPSPGASTFRSLPALSCASPAAGGPQSPATTSRRRQAHGCLTTNCSAIASSTRPTARWWRRCRRFATARAIACSTWLSPGCCIALRSAASSPARARLNNWRRTSKRWSWRCRRKISPRSTRSRAPTATRPLTVNNFKTYSKGHAMEFGVFDQNDLGIYPLSEQYEKRLKLIEFYDRAGFRSYHMSEHHSTPLSMTPAPSVFLAAAAQRTKRLRIGALVYVLPAYHPLRLAAENPMIDHPSHGPPHAGGGRAASADA